MSILVGEAAKSTLKDLFKKLLTDQVSKTITKECQKIFPLENVMIRKMKVLKKPKFDLTKLMELYQDKPEAIKQETVAAPETTNTLSA